jgi:heme exporter protein B
VSALAAVRRLVWKDLVLEWRGREILTAMVVFSMLVAVVFNFAFSPSPADAARLLPGMLWVTLAFASTLGLSRSFVLEHDHGAIEALRLFPFDPSLIYVGKLLANLLYLLAVEALLLPALAAIGGISLAARAPSLAVILILGSLGLVAVGTLFSAMSVNTRIREVLLPVLLFPLAAPVLISGVRAMLGVLAGGSLASVLPGLRILIAFDVIFVVVGYVIFEFVLEE